MLSISTSSSHGGDWRGNWTWAAHIQAMPANHYTTTAQNNNRSEAQLQHLTTIPSIPVHKIYQHLLNSTLPIMPFNMDKEPTEHTDSIWTLFSHPGMYVNSYRIAYTQQD